jgi:hypothetical protein
MVEFAVTTPLLLLLTLGAVDFGRLFFSGIVAVNAAGSGALFGAKDVISAGDFRAMRESALADALNQVEIEVEADQQCRCPDGTEVDCAEIELDTCAGYGTARAYVRVRTTGSFDTFGAYPWMPNQTAIGRRVWMRVR